MKNLFFLILVGFQFVLFNSNCQQNNLENQLRDKEFKIFIQKFYTIKDFPFNRRKNEEYIINNNLYSGEGISKKEAMKFLNKSEKDMLIREIGQDEDGNVASSEIVDNPIYKGQKIFLGDKLTLIITEETPNKIRILNDETNDTTYYNLNIFDSSKVLVDRLIVGGFANRSKEYMDVVFLSPNHFQVYSYRINEANIIKGNIIDDNKPKTFLYISDYKIDPQNGKIKLINTPEMVKELYNFVEQYQKNGIPDDPLNNY